MHLCSDAANNPAPDTEGAFPTILLEWYKTEDGGPVIGLERHGTTTDCGS
jgi:hypothetical protein